MTRGSRILLVDDNEALRFTTAALLEDAGYVVVEAESVATGRTCLRDGCYDAVILDVHLGDGVGHDLFGDVRSHQPQAALVLLSGTALPEEMQGADLALTKGMAPDELLRQIAHALAARPR